MSSKPTNDISPETSKRICDHMNEDHGNTVFLMAVNVYKINKKTKKSGWHISGARLQTISLTGCHLQVFICCGDLCEMERVIYPFIPPLESPSDARRRLIAIHHIVTAPKFYWLITKPLAASIVPIFALLGYQVLVMGISGMESSLESGGGTANPLMMLVHSLLIDGFGVSTRIVVELLRFVFWFLIVAHVGEASYGVYHCRTMKLGWKHQIMWFVLLFLAGFPILKEFQTLIDAWAYKLREKATKSA